MDIEKVYKLYCHKNKTNGKQYFGITKLKPNQRWRNGNGYDGNIHFSRAIKKYGWDGFDHTIIYDDLTKEQAEGLEILFISEFNTTNKENGYNIDPGGNLRSKESIDKLRKSMIGHPVSDETKEKLRQANIGKKASDETKMKMSMSSSGKIKTEEHRKNLSIALTGKKISDEHRLNLSLSHLGKSGSQHPRSKPVYQIDKDTGDILNYFESGSLAAKSFGINSANISGVCKGNRKTAAGFCWEYAENK